MTGRKECNGDETDIQQDKAREKKAATSPRTVETHRENIMEKLCVHSKTELIFHAFRHGMTADMKTEGEKVSNSYVLNPIQRSKR